MSCVLRVISETIEIETLLAAATVAPMSVWRKGEKRSVGSRLNETSGARFGMSNAEFSELAAQKSDVLTFLKSNSEWIKKLAASPGVRVVADFGVEIEPPYWASFAFEPDLLATLSQAHTSLEVSAYPSCSGVASDA